MNTIDKRNMIAEGEQELDEQSSPSSKKKVRFTNIYEAKNLLSMKDIRGEKMKEFEKFIENK